MELLKGTLDILILKTLSSGSMHGYAVARSIRDGSSDVLIVEEGALYPALRRMQKRGLLAAEWGTTATGRQAKFYELTDEGDACLRRGVADWERYVQAMGGVLHGQGSGG